MAVEARVVGRVPRAGRRTIVVQVEVVVQYLFAEPVQPACDRFFPLGGALRKAGRMPMALPRVQVGGWRLVAAAAAELALVGAAVLPWRPAAGVYAVVERISPGDTAGDDDIDSLSEVPGVAGVWRWAGDKPRHERLETTAGLDLTVCYLDEPPVGVAPRIADHLRPRWSERVTPLLAAPFELVVPGHWALHLP